MLHPFLPSRAYRALYQAFSLFGILLLFSLSACTYVEKVRDAETAFQRKQYAKAVELLPRELKKAEDVNARAKLNYLMAESYRRMDQLEEALPYYEEAVRLRYGRNVTYKYAQALQQAERYEEAQAMFRRAGSEAGYVGEYRPEMQACAQALEWQKQASKNPYRLDTLAFNTAATDYAPYPLAAHRILFSSDRTGSEGKEEYAWTGKNFFDFFVIQLDSQKISAPPFPFNDGFHQGVFAQHPNQKTIFFTQCGTDEKTGIDRCYIYTSTYKEKSKKWTDPKRIKLGENRFNYMHPTVSPDGSILVFASDNNAGIGGYDLFFSLWSAQDEAWTLPRNLEAPINTKGDEVFPYFDADTLYFSSDGHPGMGGLDVFRIVRVHDRWEKLQNLKAPINSGGDDFGFVVDAYTPKPADSIQQMGYLSSNRKGGQGGDDIYRFYKGPEPVIDTPALADTPNLQLLVTLDGSVAMKRYENPNDPNSALLGYQSLDSAQITVQHRDTSFVLTSNELGKFSATLDLDKDYRFTVKYPGCFVAESRLSTYNLGLSATHTDTVLITELILEPIIKNIEITLENIYYDYDKSFIRSDAEPTLNALATMLLQNPELRIQLGSHTDCRGASNYNLKLSQARAESAVAYLIERGIDPERLVARGFGETAPEVVCQPCNSCSDDEHQKNRRTTFKIID